MGIFPEGVTRGRHVEIATKSGNVIAGLFVRNKNEVVYLKFTEKETGDLVFAHVNVEDIDTLVMGPKVDDSDE